MSNAKIHFINGGIVKIDLPCDVNFHEITGQYLTFDNFFLNIRNILYIEKEEEDE